jgi:hypothetical protein
MTKQDILDILDKNAASNRSASKLAIYGGVALILGAVALYIFMEDERLWAYILGGIGLATIVGSVRALKTNKFERDAQMIKDVFHSHPKDLVWSYTLEIKRNSGTTRQVIMKFRDGTQFEIDEDAIPSNNTNDLVQALVVINPDMVVGYSEETERMYKANQL